MPLRRSAGSRGGGSFHLTLEVDFERSVAGDIGVCARTSLLAGDWTCTTRFGVEVAASFAGGGCHVVSTPFSAYPRCRSTLGRLKRLNSDIIEAVVGAADLKEKFKGEEGSAF